MNVLHLRYAVEVAKLGSLSKAAEQLMVAQSNLSRSIRELEEDLSISLFVRTPNGMVVTPEGEVFIEYARNILRQIAEAEEFCRNGVKPVRRFSASVPRASYVSEAFARFSKMIGDSPAELYYRETSAEGTFTDLLQNNYDLGIVRYAKMYDNHFEEMYKTRHMIARTVTEFRYVLIMSKDSPLAAEEKIHFSDLRDLIEIGHHDPYVPQMDRNSVDRSELPNSGSRKIYVYERASQFDVMAENKEAFMWVSPIPQKLLDRYDLVQRECDENMKYYKDVLVYRDNYSLTRLDNMFIDEVFRLRPRNE